MYTELIHDAAATERSARLRRQATTYRMLRGTTRRRRGRHRESTAVHGA